MLAAYFGVYTVPHPHHLGLPSSCGLTPTLGEGVRTGIKSHRLPVMAGHYRYGERPELDLVLEVECIDMPNGVALATVVARLQELNLVEHIEDQQDVGRPLRSMKSDGESGPWPGSGQPPGVA
jgi:hypothetical protein